MPLEFIAQYNGLCMAFDAKDLDITLEEFGNSLDEIIIKFDKPRRYYKIQNDLISKKLNECPTKIASHKRLKIIAKELKWRVFVS